MSDAATTETVRVKATIALTDVEVDIDASIPEDRRADAIRDEINPAWGGILGGDYKVVCYSWPGDGITHVKS